MNFPNVFYISPFATDFRYGIAINKHIELMPDDAWIVLTDCDTMWLTPNYGVTISNAIAEIGHNTDLFTCQVNRLGNPERCYNGIRSDNSDIRYHINLAQEIELKYQGVYEEVKDRTIAGVCMIFPKKVWDFNHFDKYKIIEYKASFDVRWTRKITGKILRIMGLYLFHSYRINKLAADTTHLEI